MKLKEDDIVLCTVKKTEGTTVYLEIEDNGQGTMVLSEVAAGRIRNLREYVFPGKKIVCKVLKISKDHVELSLRRVTASEREDVLERDKKERVLRGMLKGIGVDVEKTLEKIKEEYDISEFLDSSRDKQEIFEKFVGKEKASRFFKIAFEKEEKEKIVKGKFTLKSFTETGVSDIKEILDFSEAGIKYLGSSFFTIEIYAKDFKEANNILAKVLEEIEQRAKKKGAVFEVVK